jgi:hypothetical protein
MSQEGENFLAAIALALLLGVSVIVVLQIIAELVKTNRPVTRDNVVDRLIKEGHYGRF